MRLSDFAQSPLVEAFGDVEIAGLTADSRAVAPGFLFAALSGARADGAAFIDDALARGAAAILTETERARALGARGIPALGSSNPRLALSLIAAQFYAAQPETVAAVTGTNGKTSVASFTRQIWASLGRRAASVGTLGVIADGMIGDLGHTTPDPVTLHAALADLAARGIDHLALEASSHGLDQFRLDGIRVGAAAITNITRDHLDYHGTFEAYVAAKMRLFAEVVAPGGAAIVNADGATTAQASAIARRRGLRLLTVGARGDDLTLLAQTAEPHGQRLTLAAGGRRFELTLPLVGAFQASNALVAAALVWALGEDLAATIRALRDVSGVPGRLEPAGRLPNGAAVYVDYAHTPDALETVLNALRPHARGRLQVVFGCGGDRDRGKRPQMGAIAAALADRAIVTDDNPRGEDPAAIRAEILAGAPSGALVEIADRAAAIATAVAGLEAGDVLAIAGKGHETGQIIAGVTHPFDDRDVARAAVRDHGGGP